MRTLSLQEFVTRHVAGSFQSPRRPPFALTIRRSMPDSATSAASWPPTSTSAARSASSPSSPGPSWIGPMLPSRFCREPRLQITVSTPRDRRRPTSTHHPPSVCRVAAPQRAATARAHSRGRHGHLLGTIQPRHLFVPDPAAWMDARAVRARDLRLLRTSPPTGNFRRQPGHPPAATSPTALEPIEQTRRATHRPVSGTAPAALGFCDRRAARTADCVRHCGGAGSR